MGPGAEAWREGLADAGVEVVDSGAADVAIVTSAVPEAARARAVLVEGARGAVPQGFVARGFLPLPSLERPALLLPLDCGNVLSYALETWLFPSSLLRLVRKKLLVAAPRPFLALRRRPRVTVAARSTAQPALVAAATERIGLDGEADWFLVCGQGDTLARGLFVLFPKGARRPRWVVKFARVPGYAEPFERDEAGLALVVRAGGAAAAHAPRLLGRFAVAGYEASIETAAVGARLSATLRARVSRRRKLAAIEAVAGWLVQVARETAGSRDSARPQLDRLSAILASQSVDTEVLQGLDALPAVLQHNDLGGWNIAFERGERFTALDWESASYGLPLWDLWYFLAHALVQLEAAGADSVEGFRRLFRGEAPSSSLLFRWTRTAAQALELPPDVVGRLAAACWLQHASSRSARAEALARHGAGATEPAWPAERFSDVWLADPALGLGWNKWLDS